MNTMVFVWMLGILAMAGLLISLGASYLFVWMAEKTCERIDKMVR